jgi:hypothetical protein
MNTMRLANLTIVCSIAAAYSAGQEGDRSIKPEAVSVLNNISCSNNQGVQTSGTCNITKAGNSGFVRCTCSATCLSPCSITTTVAATRGIAWGNYVPGSNPCGGEITGNAAGGSTYGNSPGTYSAVFASYIATGPFFGSPAQSSQIVDCFSGTIKSDPALGGVCP